MQSQTWRRVAELFYGALERPLEERAHFLDEACEGDLTLRSEVVGLLAHAHDDSGPCRPTWPSLAPASSGGAEAAEDDGRAGERIGPWQLVRHLGDGGMGSVYLARRADGEFRREVALKLVKRGMDSALVLGRFRAERQILAALDHPNIARLIDGGTSPDGQPYFVMEYVAGVPLDEYCRRADLPLAARLAMFLALCDAVQHAHARLVVHRDIKPRNVLVTEGGTPKLLDFGLAKFLGPGEHTTRSELRMMTLEYASPEQLRGERVTTAVDVHALGILLYELLAGHNPFAARRLGASKVARAILELEPPPPSRVAEGAPGYARALRGDLDNIVGRALHKDAARRYPSAEQLAADVRRHLRHEPVEARRDTLSYRASRFVRRHRWGVTLSCALVLAGASFTAFTLRQAVQLAHERDAATRERDHARAVTEFVTELFEVDPLADERTDSDTVTLREFLMRSEATVRRELAGRPELEATLLRMLTRLYGNLGRLDQARRLGDEALALRRRLGDTGSAEYATLLTALATVEQDQGELELAERHFRDVLALREKLYPPGHADVAEAVNNLAVVLSEANLPERAAELEALARRGLSLRLQLFGEAHSDTAQSLNTLAVFLYFRRAPGDLEEAARLYRRALAVRERLLGARHPSVATLRSNLAHALRELGRLDEACALFRTAIADLTATLGPEHLRVARASRGLSKVLRLQRDLAGAEAALRRTVEIERRVLPADNADLAEDGRELAELVRLARR